MWSSSSSSVSQSFPVNLTLNAAIFATLILHSLYLLLVLSRTYPSECLPYTFANCTLLNLLTVPTEVRQVLELLLLQVDDVPSALFIQANTFSQITQCF